MMYSSWKVTLPNEEVIDRFLANVNVWQAIFQMLPLRDRIRLEMTNKRLHILMFEYWKRVISLDTQCKLMSSNPSMSKTRWAAIVSICVNRIGDGLRSLTIRGWSTFRIGCLTDNVPSIGEGCPHVETLNFVMESEYEKFDIRFDSFSRLKTLTVSAERRDFVGVSASAFLSIPTSIEVIRGLCGIYEELFENAAQMEGFFADRPSLREVYLGVLLTRDKSKADIFRVIAERCPHLKSIELFDSNYSYCIDYSGVIALESMKELRLPHVVFDEMDIVTVCERSPLVEALEFKLRLSSNLHLQSAALNALGSLTKLAELDLRTPRNMDVVVPSLVTAFARDLARNSGASLRDLDLYDRMPLPAAAIEALANGCVKLRYAQFDVRVGEATPASIRFLIDSIVTHPSWISQTDEPTLVIYIGVIDDGGDEAEAGRAALKALAEPATNLPSGVELNIIC